jgi:hypothetical protein
MEKQGQTIGLTFATRGQLRRLATGAMLRTSAEGEALDQIEARVREILATVKPLASEYYRLTKKPLGVTGEIAEYIAAETLGLTLAPARTEGYDALRGSERIQIKGRAFAADANKSQRISRIKTSAPCDTVLLRHSNALLKRFGLRRKAPMAAKRALIRSGERRYARYRANNELRSGALVSIDEQGRIVDG